MLAAVQEGTATGPATELVIPASSRALMQHPCPSDTAANSRLLDFSADADDEVSVTAQPYLAKAQTDIADRKAFASTPLDLLGLEQ